MTDRNDADICYLALSKRAKIYLTLAAKFGNDIIELNTPHLVDVEPVEHKDISFATFSNQYLLEHMKASREECRSLYYHMAIPANFTINKDDKKFQVSGVHCFLYWLFRYTSPSRRISDDSKEWGYDHTVLSKMFNAVVDFIDHTHRFRLKRIPEAVVKFPYFNRCIMNSIHRDFPGQLLPPEAYSCALFGDCCRFRVARPSVRQ